MFILTNDSVFFSQRTVLILINNHFYPHGQPCLSSPTIVFILTDKCVYPHNILMNDSDYPHGRLCSYSRTTMQCTHLSTIFVVCYKFVHLCLNGTNEDESHWQGTTEAIHRLMLLDSTANKFFSRSKNGHKTSWLHKCSQNLAWRGP